MKKIILTIVILIILKYVVYYNIVKNDFTNSIYIITECESDHSINYYELSYKNFLREVEKFESDNIKTYKVNCNCYESYIEDNKVLNKLNMDRCNIRNETNDYVEIEGYFEKIVYLVSKLEHDIIGNTILEIDDDYYVIVELNVNWWSPYKLYKYDKENNELKLMYTFDGENVIGIKYRR